MDLAGFQRRLSEQYARLRDARASEGFSVYVIEHGLDDEAIATARALLNASIDPNTKADCDHWLVWIAAAAEVGYRYDGAEYWDSFAATFPNWPRFGDRHQVPTWFRNLIRTWYKRFADEYRGSEPSGPWARQFPIIAWPITQAILPRYLQRHFAAHLFELRHLLAKSGGLTLDEIGDLLSDRYRGGSSRFEGFLQQKALTSRIVMALGIEDLADSVAPIEKSTLDRIASDIDNLGSVGRRLREARRILRDARFINSAKPGFVPHAKGVSAQIEPAVERVERPRLVARQTEVDTWELSLALPDLASPLRQAGLGVRDLEQSRMRFRTYSHASGWVPGRALFAYSGNTEERLDAYPVQEISALAFDRPLAVAQAALNERLLFPAEPVRLLKLRADGSAFELAGRSVRANQSYIIVTANDVAADIVERLGLEPLKSTSPPAQLWWLDVPSTLGEECIAALKALDLGYRLGVRIEPLGLSPRWRTSSGALLLLDNEHALFSISSDVAVREFVVTLNTSPSLRVVPSSDDITLLSLGTLALGSHQLTVSAFGVATGSDIASETISVEVRAALPWQQSIEGKAGVSLQLEPREAPLEQFLDGVARIRLLAPPRRTVKLNARFFGVDGGLFHDEIIGRCPTPLTDGKLSELVVQNFVDEAQFEHLERAARIEVVVSLDEYGCGNVAFEKAVEPIRWLRCADRRVRLSDDTGENTLPTVERFDLNAVDVPRAVEYADAIGGLEMRGKGGLLVATLNGRPFEAIVTTMERQLSDFNDLGMPARVSATPQEPRVIVRALKRWYGARRLIGPMAFMARRNAIRALERTLAGSLCGPDWISLTDQVASGARQLGDLYARVWHSRGFGSGLAKFCWNYDLEESAANAEFRRLVELYKLPVDANLCSFALKLAFSPQSLKTAELHSEDLFSALRNENSLIRGAYFARLASDLRSRNSEAV